MRNKPLPGFCSPLKKLQPKISEEKKIKLDLPEFKAHKGILPIVNARGTITKDLNFGGGFVGLHKPTSFGGLTIGIQGGGASSKKYDWKGEGYKFTPSFGLKINL